MNMTEIMRWLCESEAQSAPRGKDSEGDAFACENDLRDYLASHLDVIEDGLQLFADEDGHKDGVEYVTPIGRIDLLTVDSAGALLVIELKTNRGSDAACGQLLRYMGWAKRHLPSEGPVRGLIIARHATERLRYATADIPHVYVREYYLKKIGGTNADLKEDLRVTLHDVRRPGCLKALEVQKALYVFAMFGMGEDQLELVKPWLESKDAKTLQKTVQSFFIPIPTVPAFPQKTVKTYRQIDAEIDSMIQSKFSGLDDELDKKSPHGKSARAYRGEVKF